MTLSEKEIRVRVDLFEFAPGRRASWATLQKLLPEVQTALFFARAFRMNHEKLSQLIFGLFDSPLYRALKSGDHSVTLQDYLVSVIPEEKWPEIQPHVQQTAPVGEFLPELWDSIDIIVAKSIQQVADQMAGILDVLPSKYGTMAFQTLRAVNAKRPTIGDYRATIQHARAPENLVILDVSGSMTEDTIRKIVEDVVALSWKANATLAIVSNSCFVWAPGTYGVNDVLEAAEYGGTYYETLAPLFERDWGTVVTVADYDSSVGAKDALARKPGRIGKVLDLSLVNRTTFLAECVGQLADDIEPLLVATGTRVLQ